MEENGMFNDAKNMSKVICNYFKDNVDVDDEKLILLVPSNVRNTIINIVWMRSMRKLKRHTEAL